MGAIGEPKREIFIPVPDEPALPEQLPLPAPEPEVPVPVPVSHAGRPVTDEALPWDVYATPITARKFARLVRRGDGIAFLPAFFQANSAPYTAASHATCELGEPHAAPDTECTCGFYAVDNDDDLWRLGGGDPELVVLDVELSGRVIEHEHGYRASDQRVRAVSIPRRCVRCGREAELLHKRLFGSVVPACPRCARNPLTLEDASAALGVPVGVEGEAGTPASRWATRAVDARGVRGATPRARGRGRARGAVRPVATAPARSARGRDLAVGHARGPCPAWRGGSESRVRRSRASNTGGRRRPSCSPCAVASRRCCSPLCSSARRRLRTRGSDWDPALRRRRTPR